MIANPRRAADEVNNEAEAAALYDALGDVPATATDDYREEVKKARSTLTWRWTHKGLEEGRDENRRRSRQPAPKPEPAPKPDRREPAGPRATSSSHSVRRRTAPAGRGRRGSSSSRRGGTIGRARRFAVRESGIPSAATSASKLALQVAGSSIGFAVFYVLLGNAGKKGGRSGVEQLGGGFVDLVKILVDPGVDPLNPGAAKAGKKGAKGATYKPTPGGFWETAAAAAAKPNTPKPGTTGSLFGGKKPTIAGLPGG